MKSTQLIFQRKFTNGKLISDIFLDALFSMLNLSGAAVIVTVIAADSLYSMQNVIISLEVYCFFFPFELDSYFEAKSLS